MELDQFSTCQLVIITLDQTIGSNSLYHKFKYQTSELQLFFQHVPILYWYPIDLLGRRIIKYHELDSCLFSAAVRNPLHQYSTKYLMNRILDQLMGGRDDEIHVLERIYNFHMEDHDENLNLLHDLMETLLDDELFVLQVMREDVKYTGILGYVSERLKDNERVVLEAVKLDGGALGYASDRLRGDEKLIALVIKRQNDGSLVDQVSNKILESKESEILENGCALENMSDTLKDNEEIVLQAVKQNGIALKYASKRLKDNELIVREAVKQNGCALKYASFTLTCKEEVVLAAVKQNGRALEYASKLFQDSEEIVLEAVKQYGLALGRASKRLQDNEMIVFESVKQNGEALEYASKRLKDNEQVVMEAVKENGVSLHYASKKLKDNESIVLEAVKRDGLALEYVSNRLKDSELIVLEAVKQKGCALKYAAFNSISNNKIVLEAVKQDGNALVFASYILKDNESIVLKAIQQNASSLNYASDRLRNDFNFAKEIFKYCNSLEIFEHFGAGLRNIEFICYFIENYQSRFHELLRNIKHTKKQW